MGMQAYEEFTAEQEPAPSLFPAASVRIDIHDLELSRPAHRAALSARIEAAIADLCAERAAAR